MIDDEEFFAWLDGELDEVSAKRVGAAVAASPDLAAKAEQHRRLASNMRGAFSIVHERSGPAPRFEPSEVIDFSARTAERQRRRVQFGIPQWAALAASLATGLIVGSQFLGGDASPVSIDGGRMVAAARLDRALDAKLASAPGADTPRIGLTFRDKGGRICRSFRDVSVTGLACRDGDSWRIEGLYPAAEGESGEFRMAAGDNALLATLIDESIAGEPFDAVQERSALEAGWK